MGKQVADRGRFGVKKREGVCAKGQRVESRINPATS